MPLASSGLRALPASRTMGRATRSIHIPAFVPRPTPKPIAGSFTQNVLRQSRNLLSRIATHLTTPGVFAPAHASQPVRSVYAGPGSIRTIHQGLSFPARYALSRPLAGPFLPRPPAVPRGITQVGLGTARNFSTGRPIFQNIVDNVPIATRAFWEADLDIKLQKERSMMRPKKYSKSKEQKRQKKEKIPAMQPVIKPTPAEKTEHEELDHYFPASVVPEVTTYLLIPLAPTPTSRLPLPLSPAEHGTAHPLLPLSMLASIHADHGTHALRVSTLFARLDASRVFDEPGVTCTAFGGPNGMCAVLEVKFAGWTQARVRGVLGEAGRDWCVLEEVREGEAEEMDDALSEMSFDTRSVVSTSSSAAIDPSASFILPTLDFSASFPVDNGSWSRPQSVLHPINPPLSDLEFHNAWTSIEQDMDNSSDIFSDTSFSDAESDGWGDTFASSRRMSAGSDNWVGLGFSSRFSGRMEGELPHDGPREDMF